MAKGRNLFVLFPDSAKIARISCLRIKNASASVTNVCIILLAGFYFSARDVAELEVWQSADSNEIDTLMAPNFI